VGSIRTALISVKFSASYWAALELASNDAYFPPTEICGYGSGGLGAATRCVRARQRRHYDVVADLSDPDSALSAVFAP